MSAHTITLNPGDAALTFTDTGTGTQVAIICEKDSDTGLAKQTHQVAVSMYYAWLGSTYAKHSCYFMEHVLHKPCAEYREAHGMAWEN